MRSLSQFLEDFVYSTDQNKTDDRVKRIVKPFMSNPKIQLRDNGCKVTGELAHSLRKLISTNSTNDGLAVTSELTTKLQQIFEQFIQSMVDQQYINLKFVKTESKQYPVNDLQGRMISCSYTFTSDQFIGRGVITVERIGAEDIADTNYRQLQFNLTIDGRWSEL